MATLVQTVIAGGGGTNSDTVSFVNNITSANWLVAMGICRNLSAGGTITPSGGAVATWTTDVTPINNATSNLWLAIFSGKSTGGTKNVTMTLSNFPGSGVTVYGIQEWSGITATDAAATNVDNSSVSSPWTGNAITPTASNDLFFAAFQEDPGSPTGGQFSYTGGWTDLVDDASGSSFSTLFGGVYADGVYLIGSGSSAQTPTGTLSSSPHAISIVANCYKTSLPTPSISNVAAVSYGGV